MLVLVRSTRSAALLRVSCSAARKYSTEPPKKSKVWSSADEAVKDVKSGDVLLCGGELPVPHS